MKKERALTLPIRQSAIKAEACNLKLIDYNFTVAYLCVRSNGSFLSIRLI